MKVLDAAWDVVCPAAQKSVLIALAWHADDERRDCWPSLARLARMTGLHRRTVMRALEALEARGLIVREARGRRTTRYVLDVDRWGHSAPRGTAPLGAQRHGGGGTVSPQVGAQCHQGRGTVPPRTPIEPPEEPTGNGAQSPTARVNDRKQPPPCPIERIVALYHEILPELPKVAKVTPTRASYIRARWREGDLPTLDDWRWYFELVRESDFLMGRVPASNGRSRPFIADLEWLTRPGNSAKVVERRYHEERAP